MFHLVQRILLIASSRRHRREAAFLVPRLVVYVATC